MKILQINNFFSYSGGAEIIMNSTASLLRQNGHKVFFFATDKQPYFDDKYKYTDYFPKYTNYNEISKSQSLNYLFKPFYNFESKQKLELLLNVIKPDIVHCHNIIYHLTPSILNVCSKNNIPVVMTLHDIRIFCPSGTLMLRGKEYCNNELCIRGNPGYCLTNKCKNESLKASFITFLEYKFNKFHKFYDKVSLFICPSQALLELAQKSGIASDKLALVNNFIDNSYFNIQPEYSNKGYFLYVGRLSREKGIIYLLEAFKKLPDIELHIVGSGPEEENLKENARISSLTNIKFLGFKSGKELEDEYKYCIATVLPCNWFEIFGLTILESFIFGKPVIASNIGAIPEIIENGKQGITIEPGNVDELSDAVRKLNYNTGFASVMGRQGRMRAETIYNSTIYYNKLINIYNKLANF